jgi:thiol-disulfide isomerase/thioredoxin
MKIYLIIVLSGILYISNSYSQSDKPIEIVTFSQLESRLKSNSDSVLVVNFWASWCIPCRKELPEFIRIDHDFQKEPVKIILVSLDFINQMDQLKKFITQNSVTPEVIVLNAPDANNWINKIDESWSGSLPATIIIKKNHKKFMEGELNYQTLQTEINSMLKL